MPSLSKIKKDFAYYTVQFDEEDEHSDTFYRFYFCEKENTYVPKESAIKGTCSCSGKIRAEDYTKEQLKNQ